MWYVYVVCNGFPPKFSPSVHFNTRFQQDVFPCDVLGAQVTRVVSVHEVRRDLLTYSPRRRAVYVSTATLSTSLSEELYDRANTNTTIVRSSCQQYELPLWITIFKLNLIYRHQASPVAKSSLKFLWIWIFRWYVWRAFHVHAHAYYAYCANVNEHFCMMLSTGNRVVHEW